jgi:hypothetical protein
MSYNIELLKYKDVQQSLDLIKSVFKISMSIEVWKWYIFNNPDGASRVYLMYYDNKLIGLHGWSPSIVKINNKEYNSAYGHSLAILPEYRNTASYIKLMRQSFNEEIEQGVDILIGHPNKTAYYSHKSIMRMRDFCTLDIYKKENILYTNNNCEEIHEFDNSFKNYLSKISNYYGFCFLQSVDRLNWRFFAHPDKPYTVFVNYKNGSLSGHIILNKRCDQNKVTHIMDVHALDVKTFKNLIGAAQSYAFDCQQIDLWCVNGYPFRDSLESIGFKKIGSRPVVIKTSNRVNVEYPDSKASYMYGDADKIY